MTDFTTIDTAVPMNRHRDVIQANNIKNIIRYLSRGGTDKVIAKSELDNLLSWGITVGFVYEYWGGSRGLAGSIDSANGEADAHYVLNIFQAYGVPKGVACYFAVDVDVGTNYEINKYVVPYFNECKDVLNTGGYRCGTYGPGSVCAAAIDTVQCHVSWLSNASGWNAYSAFKPRATIIQLPATHVGGLDVDPDTIIVPDWGGYVPIPKVIA